MFILYLLLSVFKVA